jgi:hypothetical protein
VYEVLWHPTRQQVAVCGKNGEVAVVSPGELPRLLE